jgi:hypothetical protein
MILNEEMIRVIVVNSEKHIDEIVNYREDVIKYLESNIKYVDQEIKFTEILNCLFMHSAELDFTKWKMLKTQLSLNVTLFEPKKYKTINLLSIAVLNSLIANLQSALDYEKCMLGSDEELLDKDLIFNQGWQKKGT